MNTSQYGAHEMIVMNEALMTKAANVEFLSFLSTQVQDAQLQNMLQRQVQTIHNQYIQGVGILQGQNMGSMSPMNSINQSINHTQPKLGLRNPSIPQPNVQTQNLSERTLCTIVLNLHKFGAIGWTTFALECTNPQFRSYLMNGANMCDQFAYETWNFMNQKGYYQVPTLQQNTTQTLIQSYQIPQPTHMMQGIQQYQ